jgi:5'-methylthioadenosine phosphorylase
MRAILAFSAVGSLREYIPPGTKGVRPASFFEGLSVVAHAAFSIHMAYE